MNIKQFLSSVYNKFLINSENVKKYVVDHSTVGILKSLGAEDTPVGTIISFMGNTPPQHYLMCDGTIYNIEEYQDLANFIKDQFGEVNYFGGDGITTFAVPDLRGEFLRGSGENSHEFGGTGESVGVHQPPTLMPYIDIYSSNFGAGLSPAGGYTEQVRGHLNLDATTGTAQKAQSNYDSTNKGVVPQSYSARPTNTSVMWCIKYEHALHVTVQGSNVYSYDEIVVGQWVDGKTIYRKVIDIPNPAYIVASKWSVVCDIGVPDIDLLINCTMFNIYMASGVQNNAVIKMDFVRINNGKLEAFGHQTAGSAATNVCIDYTKK